MRSFLKKNIFLFFLSALLVFVPNVSFGAETEGKSFYDLDFNFIDNPFAGQKMVTDKEYQQTVDKYKQKTQDKKTKGFWNWVFRHTLPKDRQYQPPVEPHIENYSDEIKFQKEVLSKKPSIILGSTIYDSTGAQVAPGHYQVVFENSQIKLMQGFDTIGILEAHPTQDNWSENHIIYARVVNMGEDFVKIIYSNLNDCFEAFGVIKKY